MKATRFELRWATVVARALIPRDALGGTGDDQALARGVQDELATSPWYVALVLRLALWLIWFSPLWRLRRLRTFGGLAEEEREAALEKLFALSWYPLRMATTFLKLVLCIVILGDRRILARLGAYGLAEKNADQVDEPPRQLVGLS